MSARDWQPGDVGIVDGGYKGLVFRCLDIANEDEARWMTPRDGRFYGSDSRVRPLVVIDPEDPQQVERLYGALAARVGMATISEALRSLVALPKPEEPTGLGAVVEDEDGEKWLRCFGDAGYFVWRKAEDFESRRLRYTDITAVRVLSEGVTA